MVVLSAVKFLHKNINILFKEMNVKVILNHNKLSFISSNKNDKIIIKLSVNYHIHRRSNHIKI